MRLVHWLQVPDNPNAKSGMLSTQAELIEAEMGILNVRNVSVCDTGRKEGGLKVPLRRRTITLSPWDDVLNDDDAVHIIHTYPPQTMYDMKRKVFMAHGGPEYCWWSDLYGIMNNWWQITTLLNLCDAAITFFKRDAQFWGEYTDKKIHVVRRGVDLKHWTPVGEKTKYFMHPHLLYCEALRTIKLPFVPIFAVKKIQRTLSQVHLRLVLTDPDQYINWSNLITGLRVEHLCPMILGVVIDPRPMFRGVDIGISPTLWGLVPRVPLEMNACGTPVICFEGMKDYPIYGAKVKDSPEGIASGVFKIWDKIQSDPEGEALRARRVAEREWDIRDMVKGVIKVCEDVM